jgi:WD40-like Beta Propeller Repeat
VRALGWLLLVVAGTGTGRALAGPTTTPTSVPVVQARETLLFAIPPGGRVADLTSSPDARHVACVLLREAKDRKDRRFSVVVDGVVGAQQEWVVGDSLRFSPDGGRFVYQTQHDGLMFVTVCPVSAPTTAFEGKGYFLVGRVTFSPDGLRTAYRAQSQKGGPVVMVVDGQEQGSYDQIYDDETIFSADGKHLGYRASLGGKQFFVIDGVPGKAYDAPPTGALLGLVFSADGRSAYRVKQRDECFVVVDGREGPHYEMVAGLEFGSGGKQLAYAAGRGAKQMLVVDAGPPGKPEPKEYRAYDGLGDISYSPDGRRLAITVLNAGQWHAVIDGKEGPGYDGTSPILFSPDGQHTAYVAGKGKQQFLVVDGAEGPALDGVGVFVFSPDSRRFAYAAVRGGDKVLYVDHQPFAPAGLFAFSPDGRHIVHGISRKASNPSPSTQATGDSPGAARDAGWTLAIDNVPVGPEFDGFPIGSRIRWNDPSSVSAIIGRGGGQAGGSQLIRLDLSLTGR